MNQVERRSKLRRQLAVRRAPRERKPKGFYKNSREPRMVVQWRDDDRRGQTDRRKNT